MILKVRKVVDSRFFSISTFSLLLGSYKGGVGRPETSESQREI